jgi:hypothetical protein
MALAVNPCINVEGMWLATQKPQAGRFYPECGTQMSLNMTAARGRARSMIIAGKIAFDLGMLNARMGLLARLLKESGQSRGRAISAPA